MGVPFKKIARKDPRKADAVEKFYPHWVPWSPIAGIIFTALMFLAVHSFTSSVPKVRAERLNTPKFLILTDCPLYNTSLIASTKLVNTLCMSPNVSELFSF